MTNWVFEADPYPYGFIPESTTLLIIDMQRDFVEPGGFAQMAGEDISHVQKIIQPCKDVLDTARKKGICVILVHQGYKPDLSDCPPARLARSTLDKGVGDAGPLGRNLIRGEPGFEIISDLKPLPGDLVVEKSGFGAFHDTDLLSILQYRKIRTLIVCGVATDICVDTTIREATDRGFDCIVPEDCTASYYPAFKRVSLEIIKSQNVILGWISDSKKIINGLRALPDK